jgi:hypothetical protein
LLAPALLAPSLIGTAHAAEVHVTPQPSPVAPVEPPLVVSQPHQLTPYNPMSGRLTLR